MSTVQQLNTNDFNTQVKGSSDVYVVDFWAPWCGPCRMMGPILEEFATKQTKIKVAKVNVDDNQDLAHEFGITGIPTIIIFNKGKEEQRISGLVQLGTLEKKVEAYS